MSSSTPAFQHRPTGSKQQNKGFKSGKHSSKGELKRAAAGKVNKRTEGFKNNTKVAADSKLARKLRNKQIAQNKREAAIKNNRVGVYNSAFGGIGGQPPR